MAVPGLFQHSASTKVRRMPAHDQTTLSTPGATAGESRHRPTMRDVAALAGVSIKTVSRVVNGEPGVSPELARKVEARDPLQCV